MKLFWIVAFGLAVACETSAEKKITAPAEETTKISKTPNEQAEKNSKVVPKLSQLDPAIVKKIAESGNQPQEVFEEGVARQKFEKDKLSAYAFDGTVDSGISWNDKNGKNVLIFSKVEKKAEQTLHITQYTSDALGKGNEKKVALKEYLYCDRKALSINVDEARFSIQDFNNDGIGEPTFGYTVSCDDDAPDVYKFFILEKGNKYKLTGPVKNEKTKAGKFEPNASLKSKPVFLQYLSENWVRK